MKFSGRLVLFFFILVALTTIFKYAFGGDPGWSGFSPVIAIALFAGMIIPQRNASFLLPLLSLLISDAVIELLHRQGLFDYAGFYSGQWKNYAILLLATLIGWAIRGKSHRRLLAGALAAPTLYFLVSNFMVWQAVPGAYSPDFSGLMTCYAAGLPFFRNSLMATLLFLPVILISYNYLSAHRRQLTIA